MSGSLTARDQQIARWVARMAPVTFAQVPGRLSWPATARTNAKVSAGLRVCKRCGVMDPSDRPVSEQLDSIIDHFNDLKPPAAPAKPAARRAPSARATAATPNVKAAAKKPAAKKRAARKPASAKPAGAEAAAKTTSPRKRPLKTRAAPAAPEPDDLNEADVVLPGPQPDVELEAEVDDFDGLIDASEASAVGSSPNDDDTGEDDAEALYASEYDEQPDFDDEDEDVEPHVGRGVADVAFFTPAIPLSAYAPASTTTTADPPKRRRTQLDPRRPAQTRRARQRTSAPRAGVWAPGPKTIVLLALLAAISAFGALSGDGSSASQAAPAASTSRAPVTPAPPAQRTSAPRPAAIETRAPAARPATARARPQTSASRSRRTTPAVPRRTPRVSRTVRRPAARRRALPPAAQVPTATPAPAPVPPANAPARASAPAAPAPIAPGDSSSFSTEFTP